MTTAADLAENLGLDPADIRYTIADYLRLEVPDVLPAGLCGEIRDVLDPRSERSVPEFYGQAGAGWREQDGPL